jgi:hypothetical protein
MAEWNPAVADKVTSEINRRLDEHRELLAMVKRLAFLLNSARLVIGDQVARDIAGDAVREAEELLAKVRAK